MPKLARQHKLDVLHIPSYRRMLWPRPCTLVSTIHDLAPFQVANKYDWKRMFYGRVVVKRLARRQHHIIAISQNTASDIKTFFKLPEKTITVVHNGLEHDRFFPGSTATARNEVAKRHGLQKPFFLYIARLEHPAKNHVRLISAFNQFKTATKSNLQLVLGGSDWNGAEAIHEAIRHSPFSNDIRSLGFVDRRPFARFVPGCRGVCLSFLVRRFRHAAHRSHGLRLSRNLFHSGLIRRSSREMLRPLLIQRIPIPFKDN